ncbi:MAG TPA: M4 family metallopeptidase [Holophagaceae bacterium]|nr:M4 family metallopeptidase [Holophagaceae bacterium]HJW34984.1 M4 family metallopeptidase [Holophagaceae bacterium]
MRLYRPQHALLTLLLTAGALPAQLNAAGTALALIRTQPQRATAAQAHLQERLAPLGLGADHQGVLLRAVTDATGNTTARFQQQYRGIPVWGAQWVTHQDAKGQFQADRNGFQRVREMSVEPSLSESEALAVAQQAMKAKGAYATKPQAELVVLPIEKNVIAAKTHADGSLNARDVRRVITGHQLAYHVSLMVDNKQDGVAQKDYLIHAHSGEVLREWDSLETADKPAVGTGNSQFSGTVTLSTVQKDDGTYELRDLTRGSLPHPYTGQIGNATYNLDNQWPNDVPGNYVPGVAFSDADDVWGDGQQYDFYIASHSTDANGQTVAVDAHYGVAMTWDYYKNVFGRNGIDDLGTSTYSRVHYGEQYANAFWNPACFCMTYGDGSLPGWMSPEMHAITEIDITGHEMSHGVMSSTAALQYYGESGGLNEANSDMMGKMVEFYAKGGGKGATIPDSGADWGIGWGVFLTGQPLRWMDKPSQDGVSPDYWAPSLQYLDVHYSSGAANRMFYFLSTGASADASSLRYSHYLPAGMTGLGNQKAAQIWYYAVTHYMTPTTWYFDARKACVLAATDLFGELSPEYKAVQNAFGGINVGIPADGTKEDFTPPVIQGMNVQGTSGALTLTTQATDDRAVASVDYFVDGFYVGSSTDSASGFKIHVDSTTLSNDAHTLTALAYDTDQNESAEAAPVTFTVHNAAFSGFQNGGFEWYWTNWEKDPSLPDHPWLTGYAHTGGIALGFGGNTVAFDEVNWVYIYGPYHGALTQGLKLPSDCDTLTLRFWYLALPPDSDHPAPTDGLAHDTLTLSFLDANGNTLKTLGSFSNLDDTPNPWKPVWVQQTVDLADLKGQQGTLRVEGVNDDQGFGTIFLVDDFALTGTVKTQTNVADLSGDGAVDGYDLALLMAAYAPNRTPSDARADLNGDGVVDDKDLDLLLANFGK